MKDKEENIVEQQDLHENSPHDACEEKKKNKKIILKVLNKHKIGILVVILMLTISSTLAWFTYSSSVDFSLSARIKAWKIELDAADYDDVYEFELDDMYPGMPDATGSVDIKNTGEVDASVEIAVKSLTLFNQTQIYGQDYIVEKSADGKEYIVKGYPFELKFVLTDTGIVANTGKISLSYELVWDYDNTNSESCTIDASGQVICSQCQIVDEVNSCDLEDTEMGEASATFRSDTANVGIDSLVMTLSLSFTQVDE